MWKGGPQSLTLIAHILRSEGRPLAQRESWALRREEGIPSRDWAHAKVQGHDTGPKFRAEGDMAEGKRCGQWVKAFPL